jgi:hypothetical protein
MRQRDMLFEASGVDTDAIVRNMMIGFCAAFLDLVPCLMKNDELRLQATYHGSDVHDGCHASFDNLG